MEEDRRHEEKSQRYNACKIKKSGPTEDKRSEIARKRT